MMDAGLAQLSYTIERGNHYSILKTMKPDYEQALKIKRLSQKLDHQLETNPIKMHSIKI